MTSVQKLSRIILICRQAERLAEFYIRALGFACIADSPKIDPGFAELIGLAKGQVRITSLRLGNQVIALAETQPPGCSYPGDVPGWDPLFQHFAIVVSDMTAAYANLQALPNWTPISTDGPQILPPSSGGVTAFKFRDPEGHPKRGRQTLNAARGYKNACRGSCKICRAAVRHHVYFVPYHFCRLVFLRIHDTRIFPCF